MVWHSHIWLIRRYDTRFKQSGFKSTSLSFMGALIFTPLLVGLIGLILKTNYLNTLSFSITSIAIIGVFMKLGCFFNGCCGGKYINGIEIPIQLIHFMHMI